MHIVQSQQDLSGIYFRLLFREEPLFADVIEQLPSWQKIQDQEKFILLIELKISNENLRGFTV